MIEWIVIGGMSITIYVIIYKYEKKIEEMQELIDLNNEKIERIDTNHEKLGEYYNPIEKMWVTSPKHKNKL